MTKKIESSKKLKHKDFMYCLDVLCRASSAVAKTNPQLSKELITAIDILTVAGNTEQSMTREEEKINKFCEKYEKIEEDTITDLFSGDVLYKG